MSVQIMVYVAPHIPLVKNPLVIKTGVPPEQCALKLWIIKKKKKTVNHQICLQVWITHDAVVCCDFHPRFKSQVLATLISPLLMSLQPKVTQFIRLSNNKSNNLFSQHNVQWVRQSYIFPPASNWRTNILQVSLSLSHTHTHTHTHTHKKSRQTYLWRLHATCPNVSTAPKKIS